MFECFVTSGVQQFNLFKEFLLGCSGCCDSVVVMDERVAWFPDFEYFLPNGAAERGDHDFAVVVIIVLLCCMQMVGCIGSDAGP
jgi:hypothetical protein